MANGSYAQGGGTPRADGYLEQLISSINDSARNARTAMTTLLVVVIYLGAACLAANHEALLREGAMNIPQVGISLPLVATFALAPPILVFLHLTLLIQLDLLAQKLREFRGEIARMPASAHRRAYRLLIFPLAFAQTHADRWHFASAPMLVLSWLAMVGLPLAVLLIVLVRFLPYQDDWITLMHQLWVVADSLILWFFHQRRHPYPDQAPRQSALRLRVRRAGHIAYRWIFLPVVIFGLGYGVFTQAGIPAAGPGDVRHEEKKAEDRSKNILDRLCKRFGATNEFACRYLKLTDRTLVQREAPRGLVTKYADDAEKLTAARQRYAEGLFLRGRTLRYANLQRASLFRADLIGADLRNAQLDRSVLAHAVLRGAQFDRASLLGASLNGANLVSVDLKNAKMGCTKIIIPNPQLGGEDSGLSCNQFKGANLREASLQGANLREASLQGADLREASLQGADLREASLQGADLREASLQGADLREASLQGADLREASLQGADLRRLRFAALTAEEDGNIRETLRAAIKQENRLETLFARLDRGRKEGTTGFPTGMSQSEAKTEIFTDHPVFKEWQAPVHGGDAAKYYARFVPLLTDLACRTPDAGSGIARRATTTTFFTLSDVLGLAAALLDAPCFTTLKLPAETVAALKNERTRQEAAKPAPTN